MLPLPHGRILLGIGWILISIIVVGSLLPKMPGPTVGINDKFMHFAGYFALMVWFAGLYPRNRHWILGLAFIGLGAVLEVLQGTLTQARAMDMRDLAANTAGIAAGFLLAGFGLANWARRVEAWLTRS